MPYDFSEEALLHPERRRVFVQPGRPFEPESFGPSLANAWWLSNLSHLAYYGDAGVAEVLRGKSLELAAFFDREGTQAFLAKGRGFNVLAFRGTQPPNFEALVEALRGKIGLEPFRGLAGRELRDLLDDLDIRRVAFDGSSKAQVHRGFLRALDRVWHQIDPLLAAAQGPVWYTGHSLGAALALLAAARRPPAALFTFGEPLVGNEAFGRLGQFPHFRFVNCSDVVTQVPPPLLGYRHRGSLRFFDEKGALHAEPAEEVVTAARRRGGIEYQRTSPTLHAGQVKVRELADHTILNYTAGLASRGPVHDLTFLVR
jgi:triacylglycerol lipase